MSNRSRRQLARSSFIALFIVSLSALPALGQSSPAATLQIEGMSAAAGATPPRRERAIDVEQVLIGGTPITEAVAVRAATARVRVRNFTFVKKVDRSSATLARACTSGRHFPSAILTVRVADTRPSADRVRYMTIRLQDVIITSVQRVPPSTTDASAPAPELEQVTLQSTHIDVEQAAPSTTAEPATRAP